MSKKVSLGVAATVTLIAMAVTFSMTMDRIHEHVQQYGFQC